MCIAGESMGYCACSREYHVYSRGWHGGIVPVARSIMCIVGAGMGYCVGSRGLVGVFWLCVCILGLGGGLHFDAQVVCSHINICSGRQIKGHRVCVLCTNIGSAVGPPMFHP